MGTNYSKKKTVYYDCEGMGENPINTRGPIRIYLPDNQWIEFIHESDGTVVVRTKRKMIINPQASNSVKIKCDNF